MSAQAHRVAQWQQWANEPHGTNENRAEALRRMVDCLNETGSLHPALDLSNLGLSTLPATLPPNTVALNLAHNRLAALPPLPCKLRNLKCNHNCLQDVPQLPESIERVDLNDNEIAAVRAQSTPKLVGIALANNRIVHLPESLFSSSARWVHLSGNRFSERVILAAINRMNAVGYSGPQMVFSMADPEKAQRPLSAAVADWYPKAMHTEQVARWAAFDGEAGACEFSEFLDRLRDTVNHRDARSRDPFRTAVSQMLDRMAESPELRTDCFNASVSATERCEDRVSLVFNSMGSKLLVDDVRKGKFDLNVMGLVDQVRAQYRLELLRRIGHEKLALLTAADAANEEGEEHEARDVGVHLSYQVMLNERLKLGLDTKLMRFYAASSITAEDLEAAAQQVEALEPEGFLGYLVNQSEPWEQLFKRLDPETHAAMKVALITAVSGERYTDCLNELLAEEGPFEGDALADAECHLGVLALAMVSEEAQLYYLDLFLSHQAVPQPADP